MRHSSLDKPCEEASEDCPRSLRGRRVVSVVGILLLGDGIAALLGPRRHLELWAWPGGPHLYIRAMERFRSSVPLTVGLSVAAMGVGGALIWLAQEGLAPRRQ